MKNDKIERNDRALRILEVLKRLYPNALSELNWKTPWELLVAVQLSAQCTDKLVNRVTEKLFEKYKDLNDYLTVSVSEFDKDVSLINFHANKAKNILAAAKVLKEKFNGVMPETMEELITLPGIARKSANVILYNVFGKNEGLAVDTHVIRLAQKLGLSEYKDPVKIEKDLMELVPREEWGEFCNGLTLYGRYVCKAVKHDCTNHELTKIYPEASSIWPVK